VTEKKDTKKGKGKKDAVEVWKDRNHFDDGLAFVERCKELGCQVKMMPVNNKTIKEEPLILRNGKKVAWIAPRANQRFGVYAFYLSKPREIHKVVTTKDIENEFKVIQEIVTTINELPSTKANNKKPKKTNAKKTIVKKNGIKGASKKKLESRTSDDWEKVLQRQLELSQKNDSPKSFSVAEVPEAILKKFVEENKLSYDPSHKLCVANESGD